jgi:hypothetical protein
MAHPNTVSDTPASRSAAVTRRSRNPTTPGDLSRGRASQLMMAAVGRTVVLDALDGPGLPLLRQRIVG